MAKHEKADPKEHYKYPLRRVKMVIRKGRQHTDQLSCGHKIMWRGSSSWKDGDNTVSGTIPKRRCQECYVEEQNRIDKTIRDIREWEKNKI